MNSDELNLEAQISKEDGKTFINIFSVRNIAIGLTGIFFIVGGVFTYAYKDKIFGTKARTLSANIELSNSSTTTTPVTVDQSAATPASSSVPTLVVIDSKKLAAGNSTADPFTATGDSGTEKLTAGNSADALATATVDKNEKLKLAADQSQNQGDDLDVDTSVTATDDSVESAAIFNEDEDENKIDGVKSENLTAGTASTIPVTTVLATVDSENVFTKDEEKYDTSGSKNLAADTVDSKNLADAPRDDSVGGKLVNRDCSVDETLVVSLGAPYEKLAVGAPPDAPVGGKLVATSDEKPGAKKNTQLDFRTNKGDNFFTLDNLKPVIITAIVACLTALNANNITINF